MTLQMTGEANRTDVTGETGVQTMGRNKQHHSTSEGQGERRPIPHCYSGDQYEPTQDAERARQLQFDEEAGAWLARQLCWEFRLTELCSEYEGAHGTATPDAQTMIGQAPYRPPGGDCGAVASGIDCSATVIVRDSLP
jgi:hypothetical protein